MSDARQQPEPAEHSGPRAAFPEDGRERLQHFTDAAIQAEFRTGRHENTMAEARAHVLVRIGRMTVGFLILLIGIVMLPLPGPGWLVIAAGLVVLAQDFLWAERTLNLVRNRLPKDADGSIPTRTWALIGLTTATTVSASLWWSFFR